MITVQVDENVMQEMMQAEIQKRMDEMVREQTYWDTKDLKQHTRLSWNTIQDTFFHEPGFPKAKVGGKWLFPAKEAEEFLLDWIGRRKI